MTIKITPNDKGNPPGKLADAELHFTEGPLEGLKLIGFSIWERAAAATVATSRFRPGSTASTASGAASRCCGRSSTTAQNKLRELILEAFQEYEERAPRSQV